jgi:hypothetical protein
MVPRHWARALVPLAAALLASCAPSKSGSPDSDAKAIAVADQVMQALGGKDRWDHLAGLQWTFQTASGDTLRPGRMHVWDKRTGMHRVEGKTRQGQPFLMIHSLKDSLGKAWMNGTAIEGDSLVKLTKRAKSLWTNDTYWMLMPYKLRDPGVHLKYEGESREGGTTYDKLALSFEKVGETPGDRYWVYVNRANHRVEKWDFILQDQSPPPETFTWEGWEQHDGLWFPTIHRNGSTTVYTRDVHTMSEVPPALFAGP